MPFVSTKLNDKEYTRNLCRTCNVPELSGTQIYLCEEACYNSINSQRITRAKMVDAFIKNNVSTNMMKVIWYRAFNEVV